MSEFIIENGVLEKYNGSDEATVRIPEGVTRIGWQAFCGCDKLRKVVIPESVTEIEREAFKGCSALTKIVMPSGVTRIGEDAFVKTKFYETDRNWKKGILYIGKYLIAASSRSDGTVRKGTEMIAEFAFVSRIFIERIALPEGIRIIGARAFCGCNALKEAVIPRGVTEIGEGAFWCCSSLEEVTVPGSTVSIGANVFYSCTSLRKCELTEGVTEIGEDAFRGCSALTEAVIPSSVKRIPPRAFCWCKSLSSVTFSDGVTEIGEEAFKGCESLREIVIPESVSGIEYGAFSFCKALERADVRGSIKKAGSYVFMDCPTSADIRVDFASMKLLEEQGRIVAWGRAVLDFLTRYYAGNAEESESDAWRKYINKQKSKAFRALRNEPMLYRFLTEKNTLSPKRLDTVLEKISDVECRAILLDYIGKRKSDLDDDGDGIADGIFELE